MANQQLSLISQNLKNKNYDWCNIMTLLNIINRIKCAINCLRGRPTLCGFTFDRGCIEAKSKNGTYIVNNKFMNGSIIKI